MIRKDKNISSVEKQEIDQMYSLTDFLLKSLDNNVSAISQLLSKLYDLKENTLRIYFSRRSFLHAGRRQFYLAILDDFCERYNSVEKVKQIYYKTVFGVKGDCKPLREVLKERKDIRHFHLATEKIKKEYPDKVLISAKNPSHNKKFICKDVIEDAVNLVLDYKTKTKDIWNNVIVLRNELVKHFKSKADFCWYLADISDLTQNAIYTTLFYRIDNKKFSNRKVDVGLRYLELLEKAKKEKELEKQI